MDALTIQPVANLVIIGLGAAVMLAALWIGPTFARLSRSQRATLFGIRATVILLALVALLRPGIVSKVAQPQTAVLAVLLDFSRSMRLPHLATGPNRWDSMLNVVDDQRSVLQRIGDQNIDVRFYGFGGTVTTLPSQSGQVQWPPQADLAETDLGSSIYSVIDSVRDQRLLGMVVLSDGVQNASDPEIELSQAEKLLADMQTPLVTVPFGQPSQNEQFADIALTNMPDQFTAWVKNDLIISATVEARGFANREVPIQLIVIDSSGNESLVDTIRQPFTKQSETAFVELKYTPSEAGQYRLLVRAEPQEAEVSARNNELPAFLTVNKGGLRVLYLYGSLTGEQAFLQRALRSYQDIQLDTVFVDSRIRDTQRPRNRSHLFGDPEYDVFILHDVDSRDLYRKDFEEENLQLLGRAIENGKGLLMIGGFHSFGAGLYHGTPLGDYLPIEMEFYEKQEFQPAPIRNELHVNQRLKIVVATPHFITRLSGSDNEEDIWKQLPPLAGANRFAGLKDNANVLLESTGGEPILVASQVGGRVLAFAGDTTYKWWLSGFINQHKQFWRQIILWLAFKDGVEGEDIVIELPQRRFQPNSKIGFFVRARNQSNQDIADVQLTGTLTAPDGRQSPIRITTGQGMSQIGRDLTGQPGIYSIEITGTRDGRSVGNAVREFAVFDNDKEQSIAGADPDQLNRLSEGTREWGGKMVEPAEFGQLLEEFAAVAPQMEIEVPLKWQLGDTWYDALGFVLLFVGLISTEWWLRKKWGLV